MGRALPKPSSERGEGGYGGKYRKCATLRKRACQGGVDSAKSASKFNYAVLADDVDLDFARIFEFFLNALRDIACECVHREVRDLAGVHKDAYLAAGGDRIHLFNTLKGSGEAFEVAKALEITVNGIAAGTRTTR